MRATKANCFGSVWLRASKPAKNGTQKWRVVFLFRGRESSETTPFLVCPSCQAESGADACRGPRDCRRQALNFGLGELKRMTDRWTEHGDAGPVVVAEPVPVGPPATVGDLLRVFAENYGLARESETCALHAAQALRRVIAHSLGLWKVKKSREGPRGIAPGDKYADTERIEALPLSVLDADLANGYFKARIPDGKRMERRREHVSIVKDFNSACEVLSDTARESIFRGRIDLPPRWLEFKNYPRPKLPAAEPEPFTVEQFAALVASAESLKESEPRLWLLAKIARQTGLRCGSLRELRADWVTEVHGQHYLFVTAVKGGTRGYPVKIQPATAALIREAAPDGGYVFGETSAERERLVNERHTAFMRGIAGSPERGHQQAHRLRDTLATAVLSVYKMDTSRASATLGHASPGALKHYAQWPRECSPLMLAEFAAFLG